jgi:hypothetical protein
MTQRILGDLWRKGNICLSGKISHAYYTKSYLMAGVPPLSLVIGQTPSEPVSVPFCEDDMLSLPLRSILVLLCVSTSMQ